MFSNTYNVHFFMMINFLSQFHVNEGKCNRFFVKSYRCASARALTKALAKFFLQSTT